MPSVNKLCNAWLIQGTVKVLSPAKLTGDRALSLGDKAYRCNYEGCGRLYSTQHHLKVGHSQAAWQLLGLTIRSKYTCTKHSVLGLLPLQDTLFIFFIHHSDTCITFIHIKELFVRKYSETYVFGETRI